MKSIVIGAHLLRDDIEPVATAVTVGDLYLSTLEVADDQPLGDRELLLRVAELRASLLEVATFVAIRYGFALTELEDPFGKCSSHLARWKKVLTAHRDHVEMTLKVAAATAMLRPDRRDFTSGADYLRALHAATQASNVDPAFRANAERLFEPLSVKRRWEHRDERSLELAMLVDRARLHEVQNAGEELRASSHDVPFLLSGPWPLEVFADADRE
ncbi:MAG: GvpL/GvpF family gas vesicle protein [Acidobacteriota bacterium]|nr:GvpL/GvpF family gas vesicle protein [Acidobacteriota bacterium]